MRRGRAKFAEEFLYIRSTQTFFGETINPYVLSEGNSTLITTIRTKCDDKVNR